MKRGSYLCSAGSVDDQAFMDFMMNLACVGLEMNQMYFPDDFKENNRGPCFMIFYNREKPYLNVLPMYHDSKPGIMYFDLMKECVFGLEVLVNHPKIRTTRFFNSGQNACCVRVGNHLLCWDGLDSRINEACASVAGLWTNKINHAVQDIPVIVEDVEIGNITVKIYERLEEKFFRF